MNATDMDRAIGAADNFQEILEAIAQAPNLAPDLAALALENVRRGVMTGEGPTTRGRMHFSRTIDAADAALCERILIAGGASGRPVTRAEAEILFDIHETGREREDGGHFDDLFVRAIAHHVLAAAGQAVPPRAVALARETTIAAWVPPRLAIDLEIAAWLDQRIRRNRRAGAALSALALAIGTAAVPAANSRTSLVDFAA
jgi:hypothetical protein